MVGPALQLRALLVANLLRSLVVVGVCLSFLPQIDEMLAGALELPPWTAFLLCGIRALQRYKILAILPILGIVSATLFCLNGLKQIEQAKLFSLACSVIVVEFFVEIWLLLGIRAEYHNHLG